MRILLIGSEGQLARDLAITLSHHELVLRSHQELEIRDGLAVQQVVAEIAPECIINTAAYHRVDECEDRPELAFAVNAAGIYNLARAAQGRRAKLVHFSTDFVFDGKKRSPYTEADRPGPLSVYGMSKWAGERLVERYCEKHYVIRTCGLYGAGGSASKGGNFVRSILRAAQQGKPFRVVADQIVTPTCTADLAENVSLLLEHESYGIYHMTNAGECSWFDFAKEALRLAGVTAQITAVSTEEYGAKAQRPAYSVLDNTRMRALGIEEFRPWQSALADYIREEQSGIRIAA
jgi:dTDP-4-dehydrorhamnose reductase